MWTGLGSALVGGGFSAGGSILGSILNANYAEDAASTAFARQLYLLQLQQAYATHMSNTAHQREVRDLRKAGLNPILSALGGNGATAPVVSPASVAQASGVDFGDLGLGKAGEFIAKSSAMSLAKKQADQVDANAEAQRKLNQADASSAYAKADLDRSQIQLNEELKKTEIAKQKELDARAASHGKRNVLELPHEALKYIEQRLLNSGKSVVNNSYYFHKEMRDIGRDIRNDINDKGKFDISPKRFFERVGKNPPEASMLRSGFGY